MKVLRTGMTNSVHDLGEKTAIFQRLFSYVHFGEQPIGGQEQQLFIHSITQIVNKIGKKKHCEIDRYFGKVFWAKKSAQLVIPVRSTFKNNLHPPIRGPHRQLDFI